jgi:hypothetical protein
MCRRYKNTDKFEFYAKCNTWVSCHVPVCCSSTCSTLCPCLTFCHTYLHPLEAPLHTMTLQLAPRD